MNDRFKFRVWNKRTEEMLDVRLISYFSTGNICRVEAQNAVGDIKILDDYKTSIKDIELMQCTGLKDKNGKLIYEGDIVTDGYHNMEVYYNQIDCRFILKKVTKYIIKRFGKGSFEHCYLMDRTEDYKCKDHWYKVIGNIYENPELLQECE